MRILTAVSLLLLLRPAASAGPVLDEILNYMFLDQSTAITPRGELFLVGRTEKLTKDAPLGQTFFTGPETERIVRIRTWIDPDSDWQKGEGVELVLWDSPEKRVSLGRYVIWYEFRGFQFSRPEFEINARVQPNRTYYFELSYIGDGDGKLSRVGFAKGDYKDGQCYIAGKPAEGDLCFQTHVKRPMDRTGNLKKAFARFDLSRPELASVKEAVDREDFETAIARLVSYFENRQKPVPVIDSEIVVRYDPNFDTKDGDLAMGNYFQSGEMGRGYAGPDINWRGEPDFTPDGHIAASDWNTGMNRFGPRGPLSKAYINTGNEKYAKKLNDVLIDWYLDNPPPAISKIGGDGSDPVWATLDAGIRLGHGFIAYSRIRSSPFFTQDCRFAYILHLADCADTLVLNGAGDGGNWAFTQNSSMLEFALNFPEFTNAPVWRDVASERLAIAIKRDILPDGVETESAPGYQRMSYNPLTSVYRLVKERGVRTPFADELREILEKQAEYFMYLAEPNGRTPFLGDWGSDEREALAKDAELFGRSDMLYVASAGTEGTRPKELSKLYPYAGIATLRSDWGDGGRPFEDARYLMIHGSHYGAHGHQDINGVNVYAYGRELLGDPGSYVYGSPEHALLCTAPQHNVMTIDGEDQERHSDPTFRSWGTTPVVDYTRSRAFYKSGTHEREIFYIRSDEDNIRDYWLIRDTAAGQGTHSIEQRWHFSADIRGKPCDLKDPEYEIPNPVLVDPVTLTARTTFPERGNLCIMQVDPTRLKVEETTIDTWWPRGTASKPFKMPTAIYTAHTELPTAIDTLLIPYNGPKPPDVRIKQIKRSPDGLEVAFKVTQAGAEDLFVFCRKAGETSLQDERVVFDGDRLYLRRVAGKLRSAFLVNGRSLSMADKQMIKASRPLSWIALSLEKGRLRVWTSSPDPGLVVSAPKGIRVEVTSTDAEALLQMKGAS